MDERLVSLQEWGCDVTKALNRFLEDEELYITCLETVVTDTAYEWFERSLETQDIQGAFDSAHTLKGVFANLGLTPMYHLVVEIVEPLRFNTDVNKLNSPAIREQYQKLLDANEYLKQILGN